MWGPQALNYVLAHPKVLHLMVEHRLFGGALARVIANLSRLGFKAFASQAAPGPAGGGSGGAIIIAPRHLDVIAAPFNVVGDAAAVQFRVKKVTYLLCAAYVHPVDKERASDTLSQVRVLATTFSQSPALFLGDWNTTPPQQLSLEPHLLGASLRVMPPPLISTSLAMRAKVV